MTSQQPAPQVYRVAVEDCPSGLVIYRDDGIIVHANAAMERLFGYARAELSGCSIKQVLPVCPIRSVSDGEPTSSRSRRLLGVRKDQSQFPVEIYLNSTTLADTRCTLAVVLDDTERHTNEHLKDEFVSTVSHELRTPLTSIAGSLGLLAGGAVGAMPESTMRLLKIAHKNSERLVRLINDILDIEKIESGKVVFDLRCVELHGLIEQAIEANRGYAESLEVSLTFVPAAEPAFVRVDPDRMVQVVTNLLSNACKFSPPKESVSVAIELTPSTVRIAVRDRGAGIPDDFRPRIFEKFSQADVADPRRKGGTGLGLSIVKQIVTLLGGSVGFRDADGGGTVFHVDLPRWNVTERPSPSRATAILICDDDDTVARSIAERLGRVDFHCDIAATAAESLARAESTPYQAILVDLGMPDRDGISLIQDLRASPQHQNTPIVVISADAARGRNDIRSSTLDVLDWLNKPFDIRHLVEVLHRPLACNGGKQKSILHIDNDASIREIVAQHVGELWDVTPVATIDEARRALAARNFDLAVVDLLLSQASGLDLLHELRDCDGNPIPVILYSARAANGANAAQVQAALHKAHRPIDHLVATLRKHVAGATEHHPKEIA